MLTTEALWGAHDLKFPRNYMGIARKFELVSAPERLSREHGNHSEKMAYQANAPLPMTAYQTSGQKNLNEHSAFSRR